MKRLLIILAIVSLACGVPVAATVDKPITKPAEVVTQESLRHVMQICRTDQAHGLNFRTDAGQSYPVISVLPNDTQVTWTGNYKTPVVVPW